MEFPKAFLLVTFYLFVLVKANLDDEKRNAEEKLLNINNGVNILYKEVFLEAYGKIEYIDSSAAYVKEFGKGVFENINYNTNRTAKSGMLMANLMESSNDVLKCIEFAEKDALSNSRYYYTQTFSKGLWPHEYEMHKRINTYMERWEKDMESSSRHYVYEFVSTLNLIYEATNEEDITNAVLRFQNMVDEIVITIKDILDQMDKAHLFYLVLATPWTMSIKNYEVGHLDKTTNAIQRCFS